MTESLSEQRLAENEVIFRQNNERIQKGLEQVARKAKADGLDLGNTTDALLHFYCECSDINCKKRLVMRPSMYKKLHKNSSQFILAPGHNIPKVERTVVSETDYIVVEKYMTPPKDVDQLTSTTSDPK